MARWKAMLEEERTRHAAERARDAERAAAALEQERAAAAEQAEAQREQMRAMQAAMQSEMEWRASELERATKQGAAWPVRTATCCRAQAASRVGEKFPARGVVFPRRIRRVDEVPDTGCVITAGLAASRWQVAACAARPWSTCNSSPVVIGARWGVARRPAKVCRWDANRRP